MELEADVGFLDEIDWDLWLEDASISNGLDHVFQLPNPPVTATGSTPLPPSSSSSPSSTVEEPDPPSNPSPDLLGAIETILMKDDDFDANKVPLAESGPANNEYYDQFLADILVNSPSTDRDSNAFPDSDKDKFDRSPLTDDADDDPISKKRRRQLRNKDAAVRSRERRKMYVKDLEIKSKYFEAECRRLGNLLQCCYAENHALRLSLQMNNTYQHGHGGLASKQESAVLFLELLLLGSLLWCLDIMCLLPLPRTLMTLLLHLHPLKNVDVDGNKALGSVGQRPRGGSSKMFQLRSFSKSRRCKSSRTKMKQSGLPWFLSVYVNSTLPPLMLIT